VSNKIVDGVEFFETADGQHDAQCARCGSTVGGEYVEESIDGSWGGGVVWICISSPEWCEANPIHGREFQRGAGR
jgi:hypothetical protein